MTFFMRPTHLTKLNNIVSYEGKDYIFHDNFEIQSVLEYLVLKCIFPNESDQTYWALKTVK